MRRVGLELRPVAVSRAAHIGLAQSGHAPVAGNRFRDELISLSAVEQVRRAVNGIRREHRVRIDHGILHLIAFTLGVNHDREPPALSFRN